MAVIADAKIAVYAEDLGPGGWALGASGRESSHLAWTPAGPDCRGQGGTVAQVCQPWMDRVSSGLMGRSLSWHLRSTIASLIRIRLILDSLIRAKEYC